MSIWTSVVLLGALLGCTAALPSRRSSTGAAKELESLISKLLDKYEADVKVSRDDEPNLSSDIDGKLHPDLFGVAYLGNNIYVVETESNEIQVYDSQSQSKLPSIVVSGLKDPADLTACEQSKLLFVLDGYPQNTVWRVDPATGKAEEFTPIDGHTDQPVTLSCSSGNVVITSKFTSKLFVMDAQSGQVTQTVTLPMRTITARHAVQTADGNFFVSHVAARGKFDNDGVTEFNKDATQLSKYGGERGNGDHQLSWPTYLVLLPDGGVLVADLYNKRIVELDKGLTSGTVVISTADLMSRQVVDDGSKAGVPWRMALRADGRQLCVGLSTGDVQIYDLE